MVYYRNRAFLLNICSWGLFSLFRGLSHSEVDEGDQDVYPKVSPVTVEQSVKFTNLKSFMQFFNS